MKKITNSFVGLNAFSMLLMFLMLAFNIKATGADKNLALDIEMDPCGTWTQSEANTELSVGLVVASGLSETDPDLVNVTYIVANIGSKALTNIKLNTEVLHFNGIPTEISLSPNYSGDPNNNGQLDVNEIWLYSASDMIASNLGDSFVVTTGARADGVCGEEIGAAASLLFTSGINMDVNVVQETASPGDEIEVTLTTRLLIDEDAAIQPGTTTIMVGSTAVTVDLNATQWEARDLMISATDLNNGLAFDPFNPPAGIELTNFCGQGGVDMGRNYDNVLDELEPIETIRTPCTAFGEDDILCEYPDWVFCYTLTIPENYEGDSFTIKATDDFLVWKAEESVAGTGNFSEFIDITHIVESGGTDSVTIQIKPLLSSVDYDNETKSKLTNIFPNPIMDYGIVETKTADTELKVIVFSMTGEKVMEIMTTPGSKIAMAHLSAGQYLFKTYNTTNQEIGSELVTVVK